MKKIIQPCFYLMLFLATIAGTFVSCEDDGDIDNNDMESPLIVIQDPTTGPAFNTIDPMLTISGTAEDDSDIKNVKWSINNEGFSNASGTTQWSAENISMEEGDNIFIAKAEDKAGNVSSDTLVITRNEYLLYIGTPSFNPSGAFYQQPTPVTISVKIAPNPNLITNSVELIEIDDAGNEVATICQLYDDGNLSNGDEIKGDNMFSAVNTFTLTENKNLRIKAKTDETEGEIEGFSSKFVLKTFEPINSGDIQAILSTHTNLLDNLNSTSEPGNFGQIMDQARDYLESLSEVESVEMEGSAFNIHYTTGLTSGVIFSKVSPDGNTTRGGVDPAGVSSDRGRVKIPVSEQTRGTNEFKNDLKSTFAENQDVILDKDVFIYEPFQDAFSPYNEGSTVASLFNDSEMVFNVVHLQNQECSVNSLANLTDYGFVLFATHGVGGKWILTGQVVSESDDYDLMIKEGKLRVFTNILYDQAAETKFNKYGDIYGVSPSYIKSLSGTFPNSVIVNNSCESTKTALLSNAFISKGAKTYLGYDDVVNSDYCVSVASEFVQILAVDNENTGKSYDDLTTHTDPTSPNAGCDMVGNKNMHYSNSLINGDFEFGDLTAWSKSGDGRVITQLGSETPTGGNFMGIISTGLGYTTSSGQISQSFLVGADETNINLKWNFFSEEFMEWVGSEYQDFLRISIVSDSGTNDVFYKAIDDFAGEYNLVEVSPGIVFDQGDVFSTGWKELDIDITSYQEQTITIVIESGDVGDSIYDSAVLIDDIIVE